MKPQMQKLIKMASEGRPRNIRRPWCQSSIKKGSQNSIRVVNFFCAGFVVPRKVRDDLMSEEQTNEL
jgi:hypothetical protein